jgi:hypothetical protein
LNIWSGFMFLPFANSVWYLSTGVNISRDITHSINTRVFGELSFFYFKISIGKRVVKLVMQECTVAFK